MAPPTRVRWRPGAAFLLATAPPKVNVGAWFALAVMVPLLLLALAAGMTQVGAPRAAAFEVTLLLAPALVLAVRALEVGRHAPAPDEAREQDLTRAFCLTTGQAVGFLCVVILGAPFSHESVAVGLAMAGAPLALAVVRDVWTRVFRPVEERVSPPMKAMANRNWTLEWAESQKQTPETEGHIITALIAQVVQPIARPDAPVTLKVSPVAPDEAWMRASARRPVPVRQNGNGWMSGSTQPRRATGSKSLARVQ
ncbi:hypothetical protein [Phenylobacterium sp.]|uniref:hypothetical protein n=1 Tax=Phenylobacterium sp. TaxID=1871053 RepID=UPI001D86D94D|nr:hypothetical protein [Burkholderiales bacterium]